MKYALVIRFAQKNILHKNAVPVPAMYFRHRLTEAALRFSGFLPNQKSSCRFFELFANSGTDDRLLERLLSRDFFGKSHG